MILRELGRVVAPTRRSENLVNTSCQITKNRHLSAPGPTVLNDIGQSLGSRLKRSTSLLEPLPNLGNFPRRPCRAKGVYPRQDKVQARGQVKVVSPDIRGVVVVAAGDGRAEVEKLETSGSVDGEVAHGQVAVREADAL